MADVSPKRFYPAFLDLEDRVVVIVGGGEAAEKRAKSLLKYGADITVITSLPTPALVEGEAEGHILVEQRDFKRGDLDGAVLALCVSDDPELKRAVFAEAERVGCLTNVAGDPALSSFILPSVVTSGALQIAVSTGGAAPEVAKTLRRRFKDEFGREWATWIAVLGELRGLVMERIEDPAVREAVLTAASDASVRERIAAGEKLSAEGLFGELYVPPATAEVEDDTEAQPDAVEAADHEESE